jgi:hypothetical protein
MARLPNNKPDEPDKLTTKLSASSMNHRETCVQPSLAVLQLCSNEVTCSLEACTFPYTRLSWHLCQCLCEAGPLRHCLHPAVATLFAATGVSIEAAGRELVVQPHKAQPAGIYHAAATTINKVTTTPVARGTCGMAVKVTGDKPGCLMVLFNKLLLSKHAVVLLGAVTPSRGSHHMHSCAACCYWAGWVLRLGHTLTVRPCLQHLSV